MPIYFNTNSIEFDLNWEALKSLSSVVRNKKPFKKREEKCQVILVHTRKKLVRAYKHKNKFQINQNRQRKRDRDGLLKYYEVSIHNK